MSGSITLCATPIGNLSDASERVRETLANADVLACEDTRTTRQLLAALEIRAPRLVAHHQHNERDSAAGLVQMAQDGKAVVVVSDAGMPGVSDPGAAVIHAAGEAGLEVSCVPGPTAVATAAALSGLVADGYRFVGFFPRNAHALQHVLREGEGEAVIGFESPRRLVATLETAAADHPARRAVVCRELTKMHEEVVRGTTSELASQFAGAEVRGEVVVVLEGLEPAGDGIDRRLVELVLRLADDGTRLKAACKQVGESLDVRPNGLYQAALSLRSDTE